MKSYILRINFILSPKLLFQLKGCWKTKMADIPWHYYIAPIKCIEQYLRCRWIFDIPISLHFRYFTKHINYLTQMSPRKRHHFAKINSSFSWRQALLFSFKKLRNYWQWIRVLLPTFYQITDNIKSFGYSH